jgi:hypothetical protein
MVPKTAPSFRGKPLALVKIPVIVPLVTCMRVSAAVGGDASVEKLSRAPFSATSPSKTRSWPYLVPTALPLRKAVNPAVPFELKVTSLQTVRMPGAALERPRHQETAHRHRSGDLARGAGRVPAQQERPGELVAFFRELTTATALGVAPLPTRALLVASAKGKLV